MRHWIKLPLGKYCGIEFLATDPRVSTEECRDLLDGFRADVGRGLQFVDGDEMQIGWVVVRFMAQKSGYLRVCEPDFIHMPYRLSISLNRTFLHLRWQLTAAKELGFADNLKFPTIHHGALVCNRYAEDDLFLMERFEHEGNDSGWYVGCTQPDHDHDDPGNLHRESLYQICLNRPSITSFAVLPKSTRVVLDGFELRTLSYQGVERSLSTAVRTRLRNLRGDVLRKE